MAALTKAYDFAALGEKLKAQGLPIAEEMLEAVGAKAYLALKEWAIESAVLSETKFDDFAVGFFGKLDPTVEQTIKKIDLDGDGK